MGDEVIKNRIAAIAGDGDEVIMPKSKIKEKASDAVHDTSFGLDEFSSLDENIAKDTANKGLQNKEVGEERSDDSGVKTAYSDRDTKLENNYVNTMPSITERMEAVGLAKDTAIDMILQLTDVGYIKEDFSMLGGRVTMSLKSPKVLDSARFINLFDEVEMNTQAKVEFYLQLYSVAAVLDSFRGNDLSTMEIKEKTIWIEENIPTVLYKVLTPKVQDFNEKIELLSSEEVASFF